MSPFAPLIVSLALLVVTLRLCRQYLTSMGVPVKWLSVRKILRLVLGPLRAFVWVASSIASLVRRRRQVRPLPHYTTIRLSQPDRNRHP